MTTTMRSIAPKSREVPQRSFDVWRLREDFPILQQRVHGKPLVYLDNAATSQKPQVVIDTITQYYAAENSNIHRGVHFLSEQATHAYEGARDTVRRFLNAADSRELIFVRGTTEGINLVAQSYGRTFLKAGDEIIITAMEHHSNIVPWQLLCEQVGARLRVISMNHDGEAVPHVTVDVQDLGCDFYAFSGHKLFGPTGIGILYGKADLLEAMPPYQGGGDMISLVTFEKTHYNVLPYKFEAGTPHIAGGIGLGTAIDYVNGIGLEAIAAYEHELLAYATEALSLIKGLRIIGTAKEKASVLSFVLEGIHPHDIGTILDQEGVAVRAGHHCAMPVMQRFGVPATVRASLAFYNTREEVDALVRAIHKAMKVFS